MKITVQYLKTAWYNIRKNKSYALFCVLGTALTFIFVVLVLQLAHIFTSNYPPMTNADRIIRLASFQDAEGKKITGEIRYSETNAFLEGLKDFDCISLYHENYIAVAVNGRLYPAWTGFVNADFWKVYDFDFLYGRPFTKEECTNRRSVAIITESMSQSYFHTKNGTGKIITFQGNDYEIVGVVKNISYFSTPTEQCTVWVPCVFDKFIPNGTYAYTIDVLTPPSMSMNESKERISKAVQYYFGNKNIRVDFPPQKTKTLKDALATKEGDMFQYGSMIAIFLFLLIPALNILSLSRTHTNNRAEEIAIRKTFGAGRLSSFMLIMMENFLLVVVGSVIGLLLAMPAMKIIQQTIMSGSVMENLSIVERIDCAVIFAGVLPAMLAFSLLSGGLPAYLISRRNIAHVLKGGMVWNQKISYYGIFMEQILVTVILMLSVVSVSEAIKKYKMPGLLDVENTFLAGQMFKDGTPWEEISNVQQSMNAVIENVKKLPYVKAVTKTFNLAPYMRDDELYARMNSDSIRIDDKQFLAVFKISDEFGASVLNVEMEEGRWLENHPLPDGSPPVVITRQFADKAGWSTATGKKIQYGSKFVTVVGVVAGLKQEPSVPSPVAIVFPTYTTLGLNFENLVKIDPGMEGEFIEAYNKEFSRLISSENVEVLLSSMLSSKRSWMSGSILPVALQGIPALFLFIFAFIGTFGWYWMTSQKRMKEFALRMALGTAKNQLMRIVIGESLLITGVAVLPALALSFFIYEYTVVHLVAVSATVGIMLLFAIVSAWYPAWKVSRVNPAEALQYE